jgi:hypothetical protein
VAIQPRTLRFRSHYKVYFVSLLCLSGFILFFWGYKLNHQSFWQLYSDYQWEFWLSCFYFLGFILYYHIWLKERLHHSIQVHSDHLTIHKSRYLQEIYFSDVESVGIVAWSVFYIRMKNGVKHYFSSSLERVDYLWEGLWESRRELFQHINYESFRTKLVQYDHHQKRKEWFFRHKLIDICNWIFLPIFFLITAYFIQSKEILIHQEQMYFFRLFMYSMMTLLISTFFYSILLKKFIFDKRIKIQMSAEPSDKLRDLEFEGVILQRSKLMQMVTILFFFGFIIRTDVNLFSFTKLKTEVIDTKFRQGQTLLIDNRYNCITCKYPLKDGDLIVFGKGVFGQVMARQGDIVGKVSKDSVGRTIASENIQEVPDGHFAIKIPGKNEIILVKMSEVIGKVQN